MRLCHQKPQHLPMGSSQHRKLHQHDLEDRQSAFWKLHPRPASTAVLSIRSGNPEPPMGRDATVIRVNAHCKTAQTLAEMSGYRRLGCGQLHATWQCSG